MKISEIWREMYLKPNIIEEKIIMFINIAIDYIQVLYIFYILSLHILVTLQVLYGAYRFVIASILTLRVIHIIICLDTFTSYNASRDIRKYFKRENYKLIARVGNFKSTIKTQFEVICLSVWISPHEWYDYTISIFGWRQCADRCRK